MKVDDDEFPQLHQTGLEALVRELTENLTVRGRWPLRYILLYIITRDSISSADISTALISLSANKLKYQQLIIIHYLSSAHFEIYKDMYQAAQIKSFGLWCREKIGNILIFFKVVEWANCHIAPNSVQRLQKESKVKFLLR